MVENLWRKVVLIAALLGLAIFFFLHWGMVLGLDLRGGARLVYRLDIDEARRTGQVDPRTTNREILDETVSILVNRIDPQGLLEASIQPQGSDRILIEIPGRQESEVGAVRRRIQQLGKLEWRLVIDESLKTFDIQEEKKRLEEWLRKPENQSTVGRNPEDVEIFNGLPAEQGGPKRPGKIRWVPMDPTADPHARLEVTVAITWKDQKEQEQKGTARYLPVSLEAPLFTGEDLGGGSIRQSEDQYGLPAVAFELTPSKVAEFTEFTAENKGRPFAIILNGKVRTAPVIQDRLPGRGIITGGSQGFTAEEVRNLILTLRTGSLKIKPELENEETVGPTVGEQAIRNGSLSMILGSLAVMAFMAVYYRLAGVISVIALICNMVLLLGAMSLFRFTLTLPGLAGLVLTVGMAVDANILIFERIREELDKGKVLIQAVKNGFQMALSTIVDANVTTLITALILYKVGTGPVRGFAVTLSIGIMTSVFSALVISRVLFQLAHQLLGLKNLTMLRVFQNPSFPFVALRRPFIALSCILMAGGVLAFLATDKATKMGIDFTGGVSMRVALRAPQPIDEVRTRINREIPGALVNTLGGGLGEGSGPVDPGKAQLFAVKFKLESDQLALAPAEAPAASQPAASQSAASQPAATESEIGQEYRRRLRRALGNWLVSDPFSDFTRRTLPDPTQVGVVFQIHTEEPVRFEDLRRALAGYERLFVRAANPEDEGKESARDFRITATMEPSIREDEIPDRFAKRLAAVRDLKGEALSLTEPFPEFELIGARVVGELQTSAMLAILLSLFAIVMYIRVRFHEYRYGIAAVVALVHDILIALGLVVLCNRLGLVSAEIDLPQIAAFLTIIGYSLNDTIVVFDRIRENLPRMPGTLAEIINSSINQTLSRTLWTAATTFMVLLVIFVLNYGQGNVLEGFSFTMGIGIFVGTYSSIFIASPILLLYRDLPREAKAPAPAGTTEA